MHSLSKRSNLAGLRVGFYAGDAELVEFLRAVRQHAGLMVPGPVQAAAVAALADDDHVAVQRDRYRKRLEYLAAVLADYGCPCPLPEGGFYLWVPVPAQRGDAWALAEDLAADGGLLVSPGDLYGEARPGTCGWRWSSRWSASSWGGRGGGCGWGGGSVRPGSCYAHPRLRLPCP